MTLEERVAELEGLVQEQPGTRKATICLDGNELATVHKGVRRVANENKIVEMRNAKLINLILDYAIENHMSLKEIDDCMKEVRKVYYSDGLIIRD